MSRSPVVLKASSRSGERLPTTSSTASASWSLSGGASSSGPSAPSRRRIGGTPTFRWMSLAPSSTACLSRGLSSMAVTAASAAVADEQGAPACEPGLRPSHRQAVPTQLRQLVERDPVVVAEHAQVLTQARAFGAPATDAEVDMVALREDPAVAARHRCELEHEHPPPAVARESLVGHVPLERDPVDDPAAEPERL